MLKELFRLSARMVANKVYIPKTLRKSLSTKKNKSGLTVQDGKKLVRVETIVTKLNFDNLPESLIEHDKKVEDIKEVLEEKNGRGFKIVSVKRKRLDKYHMVVSIIRYNS